MRLLTVPLDLSGFALGVVGIVEHSAIALVLCGLMFWAAWRLEARA